MIHPSHRLPFRWKRGLVVYATMALCLLALEGMVESLHSREWGLGFVALLFAAVCFWATRWLLRSGPANGAAPEAARVPVAEWSPSQPSE